MVKVSEFEAVPPGLMTVTLAVPAVAIRLADTDAVNWVVPTYEVTAVRLKVEQNQLVAAIEEFFLGVRCLECL